MDQFRKSKNRDLDPARKKDLDLVAKRKRKIKKVSIVTEVSHHPLDLDLIVNENLKIVRKNRLKEDDLANVRNIEMTSRINSPCHWKFLHHLSLTSCK